MENFSGEDLMIFLLAGFSVMNLFKRSLSQLFMAGNKTSSNSCS